jgi:hypothetical protein
MNREQRKRNKIAKENRAGKMLKLESEYGNRSAASIRDRITEVECKIAKVNEILQLNPQDFVTREFLTELEQEKRGLINMTLQRGWPKTYLRELRLKQKQERENQDTSIEIPKPAAPKVYLTELFSSKKSQRSKTKSHE